MAWKLPDLQYNNNGRPPGAKRLRVAFSAMAYVLLGLPVWWYTTSLHRPALPHEEMRAAAVTGADQSVMLPVSLEVVLVTPSGTQLPDQLTANSLLQTLQQAVSQQLPAAAVHLSVTTNAEGTCQRASAAAAAQDLQSCSSSSSDSSESGQGGTCSAAAHCINLSQPPVSSSSSNRQQQLQLDDWLLQQQQQEQVDTAEAAAAAAVGVAAAGHYVLYLLPAPHSAAAAAAADHTSELVVGRHRHAWWSYSPELAQQQQQRLLHATASAAVQLLSCCFGLHSSPASVAAAASLPVSAAGHTQLSFSLLNAAPATGWHFSWDFESFEEQYLLPVAASLAPVAGLSIESQVLLFTPARERGRWSKQHQAFVVRDDQLPFFIDSEWSVEAGRAVMQNDDLLLPGSSSSSRARQQATHYEGSAASAAVSASAEQAAVLEPHVLHFLVYVPPRRQHPLLLLGPAGEQRDSNSFWIPSWGGLLVLSPPEPSNSSQLSAPAAAAAAAAADSGNGSSEVGDAANEEPPPVDEADDAVAEPVHQAKAEDPAWWEPRQLQQEQYHLIAQVVVAQLQALFGVAPTPTSPQASSPAAAGAAVAVVHLPAGRPGFSCWQIDALLRQRTAGDVVEAARVLGSLSKLVLQLPNLEMPDVIGEQVQQALSSITAARRHIAAGDYAAGGAAASAARAAAEAAFLHPAVLAQLNFPESHKLGVYMPLFLPMSVPLLQGLMAELKHYVARRRQWQRLGG